MKIIILDKNWDDQEKELLKDYEFSKEAKESSYVLCKEDDIFISLDCKDSGRKKEIIKIDFLKGDFLFRLKSLSLNQPLFRALNIQKNKKIFDATAGFGKDSLTFTFYGCDVLALEQNPIVYLLLKDGLKRAFQDERFKLKMKGKFRLLYGDSVAFLTQTDEIFDAIYIDPMYPQTKDKTSKSKKEMGFLQEILPQTKLLEKLLESALVKTKDRVVLKRPPQSDFILKRPSHSFESKLVRFDMYLP